MAHGMFYTDFVATAVYGGQPDAAPGSVYDLLFDEGVGLLYKICKFYNFANSTILQILYFCNQVRMGSWGLLLHSITAGVYALFIQVEISKNGSCDKIL